MSGVRLGGGGQCRSLVEFSTSDLIRISLVALAGTGTAISTCFRNRYRGQPARDSRSHGRRKNATYLDVPSVGELGKVPNKFQPFEIQAVRASLGV